jgi:hypothetical protein
MDANKYFIRQDNFTDKQLVVPIKLDWDYLGIEQSIDLYEQEVLTEVIGVGRDFEVDRFSNEPYSGSSNETAINYQFYFYSGGSMDEESNWRIDYRSEGFTTRNIYYYENNFSNSFFKLDLYDSTDDKKQKNYITIIIPTQQGLKMDAKLQRTDVTIKKPEFVLDFIGDVEGFFIYWLKKKTFLDIDTFYMTAKFYNADVGAFTKMMNVPQSSLSGDKYNFDNLTYFYYQVKIDYDKRTYQVFNINPNITTYPEGQRAGTPVPIKWYEYVNP